MEPKTDDPTCSSRRVGLAEADGTTTEIIKASFPLRSDFVSRGVWDTKHGRNPHLRSPRSGITFVLERRRLASPRKM